MHKINCKKLIRFVGYGPKNKKAKVLFLGLLEEKAHDGEERKNWQVRSKFHRIEDLRKAHDKLGKAGLTNRFEEKGNPVRVWNVAARFTLRIERCSQWNKRQVWSKFWREELGRSDGSTFLMECFPFPQPEHRNGKTMQPCPEWTAKEVWEERCKVLRRYLDQYPPEFVVAYGRDTKGKVADLFKEPEWKLEWKKVRGVKHKVVVASNGNTRIAHCGHFSNGHFCRRDIPRIVSALEKFDRGLTHSRRR